MRVNEKTTGFELRVAGKMQRLITSVVNKSLKNYLHKQQRMGTNEQKNTAFLYSFINKLPSTILPNPEPRTPKYRHKKTALKQAPLLKWFRLFL
ncbi:hypothetical protein CWB75_07565 [Pseudoalteromonas sp. S1608]|nr:hypothetical protein CWB75_07565 [Pseudoalteromonas sp. S1608]